MVWLQWRQRARGERIGGARIRQHHVRADGDPGGVESAGHDAHQKTTAVGAATAIVVGLVAITPAAGFVSPLSGIAIGGIAAAPSYFAILWRARTRLDDSLDVVAAHGVGGTVGALLTGVLAQKSGTGRPMARCSAISRSSVSSLWR